MVREVAVQRADPDVRASRDLLQRRRGSVLGECVARGGDQLLVVSQRVGPLRARHGEVAEGVGGAHGANSWIPLTNRRLPPYSTEGSLHLSLEDASTLALASV